MRSALAFLALLSTAHGLYEKTDDVVELTVDNFKTDVVESGDVWFVEFFAPWCGHCKTLVPEYKKLATALKGVAKVGAVDMTVHDSVGKPYGVKGFPTIKIFGSDKKKPSDYEGDRTASKMAAAALRELKEVVKKRLGIKSVSGEKKDRKKAKEVNDVVKGTSANFDEVVLQSEDLVLVEFFAPWCGHCKTLAPEWKEAAGQLKGKGVTLVAVDATVHADLGSKYKVLGYPTIKVFTTEGEVEDYSGGRTAAAIVKWALDKAGKTAEAGEAAPEADAKAAESAEPTAVVTLTDANFEEQVTNGTDVWLIDFYAPWCGHCKTLAPKWAEASLKLIGKVKFGAVDCDSQKKLQSKYEIQGFPTLKLFAPGAAAETIEPGRHTDSIVSFAEEALAEANRKPREVCELTSDEVFQEECSTSMCVVAFLPHILDTGAAGRQIYLDMIRDLAVSNKKINMGFVWAEATQQAALEARLGAGGTGYPALAAVSAKKGLNIPFYGGFTGEKIAIFLERALKGKEKAKKLKKGLPELVTTTAWDGKDGEAPKEEL